MEPNTQDMMLLVLHWLHHSLLDSYFDYEMVNLYLLYLIIHCDVIYCYYCYYFRPPFSFLLTDLFKRNFGSANAV